MTTRSSRWEKTWLKVGKGYYEQTTMKRKEKNSNKITKLVEFTLEKKNPKFPNVWVEKMTKFLFKKKLI